jgi:hypothetical protein
VARSKKHDRRRPFDLLDSLSRALKVAEEALASLEDDFRDDPDLPEMRAYLLRKRQEFRTRIRRLVERN